MKHFTPIERTHYVRFTSELSILCIDCGSKEEFEKKSLSYVEGLFARFDITPLVYYSICEYRAVLLETVSWG